MFYQMILSTISSFLFLPFVNPKNFKNTLFTTYGDNEYHYFKFYHILQIAEAFNSMEHDMHFIKLILLTPTSLVCMSENRIIWQYIFPLKFIVIRGTYEMWILLWRSKAIMTHK